ncbi:MAG TPA: hypothetical protein DCZ75_03435 [Geobacter sp.]|nr:hypothetical protein [Geobacter sp.]
MVKCKRGELIDVLQAGDKVPVKVTGRVGSMTFEGVDVIRVVKWRGGLSPEPWVMKNRTRERPEICSHAGA